MGFGLYAIAATESPTFFTTGMTGSGPSGSAVTNPSSLLAWNVTNATSLSRASWIENFDVHGWSWTRWTLCNSTDNVECILIETYDSSWSFVLNRLDLIWLNTSGIEVSSRKEFAHVDPDDPTPGFHTVMTIPDLDAIYGHIGPIGYKDLAFLKFDMTNDKGTFTMQVSFDEELYADPPLCLSGGGDLEFSINQDFSDRHTSVNLLSFIGGLFSFSTPGVPYPISTIVSMIWWGCVGALSYVVLTIIRSFIPFLGGGD